MSKKLTFHCVSGRDLLTVGRSHLLRSNNV